MPSFTECCAQGRFRVRSKDNKRWLDSCEYETYIRNETNTGWLRIIAGKAVVRHGTNQCWVVLGCDPIKDEEDSCEAEYAAAGLTPSGQPPSPTTTTAPDGTTTTTVDNPDGTTTTIVTPPNGGTPITTITQTSTTGDSTSFPTSTYYGGPTYGTYTTNNNGVTNNFNGVTNNNGGPSYYYGTGSGLGTGISVGGGGWGGGYSGWSGGGWEGGINCISIPSLPDCVPLDPYGGYGLLNKGTIQDPLPCGNMVWSWPNVEVPGNDSCHRIQELLFDVGTTSGTIALTFKVSGKVSFEIQYGNSYVKTDGFFWSDAPDPQPKPVLLFDYQYDSNIGQLVKVRTIRQSGCGITSSYNYLLACPDPNIPVDDDGNPILYGTPVNPAPCDAAVDPEQFGGQGLISVTHSMGTTAGMAYIDYQMWYQPDRMDVFQSGTLIATTGGYVSGLGQLAIDFDPTKGSIIVVRIHARDPGTSWGYRMSCPGEKGREGDPKPCTDQFESSGAGVTDTFVDCGPTAGIMVIDYNAWYVEDSIEVFQSGALLASTNGFVTGISSLTFVYDPSNGTSIMIRVIGDPGTSTWGIKLTCPVPAFPILSIQETSPGAGIEVQEDVAGGILSVDICGDIPAPADITFDYYTEDATAVSVGTGGVLAQELIADSSGIIYAAGIDTTGPNGEQIRVLFDGGFSKYTNAAFNGGSDYFTLPSQFQYMHNIVQWMANPDKVAIANKRVLILGDVDLGTDYCVSEPTQGTGFALSVVSTCSAAGFNPVPIMPSDIGGAPMSAAYTSLDQFCCAIVISSNSSGVSQLSPELSAMFVRFIMEGNGVMVITQSPTFQGTANDIARNFGVEFGPAVTRTDIPITYVNDTYGQNPPWLGVLGSLVADTIPEGEIVILPSESDYTSTFGTATIPKGQTCITVDVPIIDDIIQEPDEVFNFVIANPTNVDTSDTSGYIRQVTIIDNDFPSVACGGALTQATSQIVAIDLGAVEGLVTVEYATDLGEGSPATITATIDGTSVGSSPTNTLVPQSTPGSFSFFFDPTLQSSTVMIEATGDTTWMFGVSCPAGPIEVEALVFSTTIEVTNLMQTYSPPTPQDIFNTWSRTDGNSFYPNAASAAGAASDWQLVNGNILMPTNTSYVNTVISPDSFSDYTHAVTLISDNVDNDGIGAVLAYSNQGGDNHILAIVRTKGGVKPYGGCAIMYYSSSAGLGFNGGVVIVESSPDVSNNGQWSNDYTKVRVTRTGDLFTVEVGGWNSPTYDPSSTMTVDISTLTTTTTPSGFSPPTPTVGTSPVALNMFSGPKPYGYFTLSQPNTTYRDILFNGGTTPLDMLFDSQTGDVWKYISGSWQLIGNGNWDTYLGGYSNITNPTTHVKFLQKGPVNTLRMNPLDANYIIGSTPDFTILGIVGTTPGTVAVIEKTFSASAGTYQLKATADDAGEIFINGISYGNLTMNTTLFVPVTLISGLNVVRVYVDDSAGGALSFGMKIPGIVSSDDFNGWSGTSVP